MAQGLADVTLNVVNSVAEAYEFMSWLSERREVLGVDTETGGLNWLDEPLRLVQFGDTQTGWAIPWERWGGVALEALDKYDGPMVFHNAKFDVHFIEHHSGIQIPWRRVHNTRIMAHLIDPTFSTALKPLAGHHIDRRAMTMQAMLDDAMGVNKWTWRTVPLDFQPYWAYAALDPVLTAQLYEKWKPTIDASYRDVYELEVEVERVVMNMENRGARIDLAYCREMKAKLEQFVEDTTAWTKQNYGINPGNNEAVVRVFQGMGYEFTKLTDSGRLALDKEVLQGIDHPLAKTVLDRRRAQKVVSTYYDNFLEFATDDIVRCKINTLGARTARMSVSEPALQTLPREAGDNPFASSVRDAFVARQGHHLLASDFDQIELRIFADLSEDENMISAVRSGEDPFSAMARTIYSDPTITKKDHRRQMCKNGTYAKFYGAGKAKFSLTAGVSYEVGSDFMDDYDLTFPGVRIFQNRVAHEAMMRKMQEGVAYVLEPSGRRHPADDGKEYALVNYLIQGYAGTIFKRKLVELDNVGLGSFMILPVHDEILMDVPDESLDEAKELTERTMRDEKILCVPITAGVEIYERWGDKYRLAS